MPSASPSVIPTLSTDPTACTNVSLKLTTDSYGNETFWDIKDLQGNVLASVINGTYENNKDYTETECIAENEFFFTIYDDASDGMCCNYDNGSYELSVEYVVVRIGAEFAAFESTTFPECSGPQVTLELITDEYGAETSWDIKDSQGNILLGIGTQTYGDNETYTETFCLPFAGPFDFTISDSEGDGICCGQYGDGAYKLYVDGNLVHSGGEFFSYEITSFV